MLYFVLTHLKPETHKGLNNPLWVSVKTKYKFWTLWSATYQWISHYQVHGLLE